MSPERERQFADAAEMGRAMAQKHTEDMQRQRELTDEIALSIRNCETAMRTKGRPFRRIREVGSKPLEMPRPHLVEE